MVQRRSDGSSTRCCLLQFIDWLMVLISFYLEKIWASGSYIEFRTLKLCDNHTQNITLFATKMYAVVVTDISGLVFHSYSLFPHSNHVYLFVNLITLKRLKLEK